jgi:hypothetical protein
MRNITKILLVFVTLSCQQGPENRVLRYFKIANEVVNGDTSEVDYLKTHLSKNAKSKIESLPLLMPYSLLSITQKGTLALAEIKDKQMITKDSVILDIDLIYFDGKVRAIQQAMVFEDNEWKLGISAK